MQVTIDLPEEELEKAAIIFKLKYQMGNLSDDPVDRLVFAVLKEASKIQKERQAGK